MAEGAGTVGSICGGIDHVLIALGVDVKGIDGVGKEHDAGAEDESFHECEEEEDTWADEAEFLEVVAEGMGLAFEAIASAFAE